MQHPRNAGNNISALIILRPISSSSSPAPAPDGEFPLSINHLQDKLTYTRTNSGELGLRSKISLPAGALFASITAHVPQPHATWRTVQTSATTHTELRSALLYLNHSCRPSLELHVYSPDEKGVYPAIAPLADASLDLALQSDPLMKDGFGLAGELLVAKNRDLAPGEELTFFYPSTEWKFDREFECGCGEEGCLGMIGGALAMDGKGMERRRFLNAHIWELLRGRDGEVEGPKAPVPA